MTIDERKLWPTIVGICVCIFIIFTVAGCHSSQKQVSQVQTKAGQQSAEPWPPQPESSQPPVEASAKCPDRNDVRRSIVDGQKILSKFDNFAKNSDAQIATQEQDEIHDQILEWQKTNKSLIDGCDLLLGADGTAVYPEIPLSLQNLSLAVRWLLSALDCISNNELSTSRLYIKAAENAIKQAEKVLDKRLKNRRSAVLKIPGYLKAAESARK